MRGCVRSKRRFDRKWGTGWMGGISGYVRRCREVKYNDVLRTELNEGFLEFNIDMWRYTA